MTYPTHCGCGDELESNDAVLGSTCLLCKIAHVLQDAFRKVSKTRTIVLLLLFCAALAGPQPVAADEATCTINGMMPGMVIDLKDKMKFKRDKPWAYATSLKTYMTIGLNGPYIQYVSVKDKKIVTIIREYPEGYATQVYIALEKKYGQADLASGWIVEECNQKVHFFDEMRAGEKGGRVRRVPRSVLTISALNPEKPRVGDGDLLK